MFREELVQQERDRCRGIAAKVFELSHLWYWSGPEWTAESAAEDVASFIAGAIEAGMDPEEVERALRAHLNG